MAGFNLFQGFVKRLRSLPSRSSFLMAIWFPLLYQILAVVGLILALWEAGDRGLDARTKVPSGPEYFDFIIVGAGSAGSVIAYRLSQYYSVLLLEAGGEPNPLQYIPGFGVFLINYPETDWMHRSVPQKYSTLNSINQESSWSAGRGLGGTGTLNLLVHLRGHTKDYDNWARITGDPSWSWEGVLPYFNKYETYEDEEGAGKSRYHGYSGPIRIAEPNYVGLGKEFAQAGAELGYPVTDLNAPFVEGFDTIKSPNENGMRNAPYKAILQGIRRTRKSLLTIRKFSHVTKILFEGSSNVAIGVEYDRHGQKHAAYAKKEVIVSAGSITTPRVLMLSGVGPAAHLQENGIPVRVDLPVGEHLQDHTAAYLGPFFVNKPRTVLLDRDLTPSAWVQWFTQGSGILSSTGANSVGIISSEQAKARGEGDWPDLVLYLFGFSVFKTYYAVFSKAFNIKIDELEKYYEHAIGKESFLVAISGARPLSKGYIKLGGTSPYDKLVIDPNYFSDEGQTDVKAMVDGIKTTLRLVENTTTLGVNFGGRFTTQPLPGCEPERGIEFRSDAYWECYARRYTVTLHHPVGTCGMGRVVDTQLRVYGTQRLRVIDSSIQPEIVTTNTQASALMIGEKGADMVLQYWKNGGSASTTSHKSPNHGWHSNSVFSMRSNATGYYYK